MKEEPEGRHQARKTLELEAHWAEEKKHLCRLCRNSEHYLFRERQEQQPQQQKEGLLLP